DGRPASDPAELYQGAANAGAHHVHADATASVSWKGCRLRLGLRAAPHRDPWDEVVKDLLRPVRRTGGRGGLVRADRGFYRGAVLRYLPAAASPLLLPVIRRGRRPHHPQGASGTEACTTGRRSGGARYTLEDKRGRRATGSMWVCGVRPVPRRPGARGRG